MLLLSYSTKLHRHIIYVFCRAEDVIDTIELLLADMPYCNSLIQITPTFKTHQTSWDKVGSLISHYQPHRVVP